MSFGFAQRLSTVLTALAAFTAVAVGGALNPVFVVVWYLVALWALRVPDGRFRGAVVAGIALVSLPIAVALAIVGVDVVLATAYFASTLLLARVVARNGPGEHGQAHLLAVLVLAGGAALSGDVTYLIGFVVFLFAATWALLLTHLRRELGADAMLLPVREVIGRGLATGVLGLTVVALVATAVTFVVFPRTTFGLGFHRPFGSGTVGLSDRITLAGFGRLKENGRVVLRVSTDAGDRHEERLDTYWRTQAFEHYDGGGWSALRRRVRGERAEPYLVLRTPEGKRRRGLRVQVVSNLGVDVLPVPDTALTVLMPRHDAEGAPAEVRDVGPDEVRTAGRLAVPFTYRIVLDPGHRQVDRTPPVPEDLALPPVDPRIRTLAKRLETEAGSRAAVPAHIADWLSSTFAYSTELPGADPSLAHFLFERRAGHCEYFATAMTVLLRLDGIPARVATGFYGGEWSDAGGYYLVRENDAHAWVEAWEPEGGWRRYDPTPPDGRGSAATDDLLTRLSDAWDALQKRWSELVLDFDLRTQIHAFRRVSRAISRVADAFAGHGTMHRGFVRLGLLLIVLGLAGGIVLGVRRRRGRAGPRPRSVGLMPGAKRARAVYRELWRAAESAGITRSPGDTADDLLRSLEATRLASDATIGHARHLVERYEEARFGARPLGTAEARELRERARVLGRRLRESAGRDAGEP